MNAGTVTSWAHLEPRPRSFYRQLFVKGTRLMARSLYGLFMSADDPMTVEEIASEFGVPVAAVQEAIAYCQSNPPEIEEDYRREESLMAATGMAASGYRNRPSPRLLSAEELARLRQA